MGRGRPAIQGLTSLEADIMNIVWDAHKTTVREVHEKLLKKGYIPYTTIMATMVKLANMGLLTQNKVEKAYRYASKISRAEMAKRVTDSVVRKILKGNPDLIISHLLKIDESDVNRLRDLSANLPS
ncbi:MAG: BlaI/MecI/CopY family transcriptional regulator [Chloroflexi bacterium]|nr:BlaI/MecI/CopY family transcriptional regulator [Chloroflexota bacterium]